VEGEEEEEEENFQSHYFFADSPTFLENSKYELKERPMTIPLKIKIASLRSTYCVTPRRVLMSELLRLPSLPLLNQYQLL